MATEPRYPGVTVRLTGGDSNAMSIIGAVSRALRRAGLDGEIPEFVEQAMSGDYDNVLRTAAAWVTVK